MLFACAGVIVRAAVTAFRFRDSISATAQPDALARTGLEHYRAELVRRRDHLRSGWIWHGPLLLAGILSAATLSKRIVPGRLWDALPVFVLLAVWTAIGIRRRLRRAAELQQEIDESPAYRRWRDEVSRSQSQGIYSDEMLLKSL